MRVASAEEVCEDGSAVGVHLPSPSFWPIVFASGLPFIALGLIFNLWLTVPGGLLVVMAIYAWIFEPVDDPDAAHGDHDDHGGDEAAADTIEEAPVV